MGNKSKKKDALEALRESINMECRFKTVFTGYDKAEVKKYLDELCQNFLDSNNALTDEMEKLKAENSEIITRYENIDAIYDENTRLGDENSRLAEENKRLGVVNIKLQAEYAELRNESETLRNKNEALQCESEALRSELESLKELMQLATCKLGELAEFLKEAH